MSLNDREFLLWKEMGRGEREKEAGGRAGRQAAHQAGIFKVRLGLEEMDGRDRDTER
jgi:hypothetical protein